ncbi:uncharacterized protein Z519_05727 [Cladophialophora bantiana CBS 173.52]|uniref:Uncharacterized protein n=1 Tax=Cladophialophora bantiana (strain ATCC 10958 / CBS 173.52 / CDC B-1940 / NIH 8579) TaxID=1442370 RepID=A0A0D2G370_CLAB1|nr:uncharacterized protein Z519_05727 [Cladophialophora bantiana CBS 173.52]KIW93122.1 hypothetical protein Z519_05727 [Cladophialophora bantiana CBS 173.52]
MPRAQTSLSTVNFAVELRLEVRASHVEKPRRVQRHRDDLPSEYDRFLGISIDENRVATSYDFGEDLSELGEDKEDDRPERSYRGSDAEYYYELKEFREERKLEKLRERKEKE